MGRTNGPLFIFPAAQRGPPQTMRITILGTGAMACVIGARLAAVAPQALALVGTWSDSLAAIRRRGIVLLDPAGTHAYPAQAFHLGQPVPPAEIVLVLVKAWQTAAVAPYVPDLVKPGGVVISLQHSLGNLEQLGPAACLGVTETAAELIEPGYASAGPEDPISLAAPEWAVEVFRHAGFDVRAVSAEAAAGLLWGRLAIRCGLEALSAILREPYGRLYAHPDARLLIDRAATECALVAWAQHLTLPFADPLFAVQHAAEQGAQLISPMARDLRRRTPTEVDALNGAVTQAGFRAGVHTTVNEILWRQVRALAAQAEG